jgi:hypothetical protein
MKQMSIGREPDFLMKLGQIEMMHAVSAKIIVPNSQSQTIKIVDRSLFSVCIELRDLLNAKSPSHLWTISRIDANFKAFNVMSSRYEAIISFHFPDQMSSEIQLELKGEFIDNLRKLSK